MFSSNELNTVLLFSVPRYSTGIRFVLYPLSLYVLFRHMPPPPWVLDNIYILHQLINTHMQLHFTNICKVVEILFMLVMFPTGLSGNRMCCWSVIFDSK